MINLNNTQILGIMLNFIIYIIMIIPIVLISLNTKIYNNRKNFISSLLLTFIFEILFSLFLYCFSKEIFSIFPVQKGTVNYAIYASKILFISSSLYGIKILIPAYLFQKKDAKKSAILVLSKIAVSIIFIFIAYSIFNVKGILYSLPICDLIFYVIYILYFNNYLKSNLN